MEKKYRYCATCEFALESELSPCALGEVNPEEVQEVLDQATEEGMVLACYIRRETPCGEGGI